LTVLIRGETGTGKELVASAIHYQSPRQGKAFVAINCAAIPDNLVESELFGYEKGAFTGAQSRKLGRFELANGGTIFLDELGELSLSCQAKLLRLIEEQQFERVGGTESISVNVRIIAATNKDLPTAVTRGEFREDLFYRLNVLMVELPPLREHPDDVLELVHHFLGDIGFGSGKTALATDAEQKLREYHWPGNVRQLRNVIESAVVLGDGETIRAADLIFAETSKSEANHGWSWKPESLEEVQKKHIRKVLEYTGGNKKKAAEILGIERCTLYSKLKAFDIKINSQ
jgi:transcriptional regulator with PAS, ATPase and Fis domain